MAFTGTGNEPAEAILVHDGRRYSNKLHQSLMERFRVRAVPADSVPGPELRGRTALVVSVADLTSHVTDAKSDLNYEGAVFVLADAGLAQRVLAQNLGARAVFAETKPLAAIHRSVASAVNEAVEQSWAALEPGEHKALRSSVKSFGSLMEAGRNGEPLPMTEIHSACEDIRQALGVSDVDRWMNALSGHHDGTYRHSMYVGGVLAFFAHEIGITGQDLTDLTTGGFLHDVGKSQIPLAILDKPGKLDDDEWVVIKRHPEHSREILLREHGLNDRIVHMAVHHHEKLDGTGYPDGLASSRIDDPTRLTAIADVYAALTEPRTYKPAMPQEKALDIMSGFEGHLDMDLLRRFREFMLDSSARQPVALSA